MMHPLRRSVALKRLRLRRRRHQSHHFQGAGRLRWGVGVVVVVQPLVSCLFNLIGCGEESEHSSVCQHSPQICLQRFEFSNTPSNQISSTHKRTNQVSWISIRVDKGANQGGVRG